MTLVEVLVAGVILAIAVVGFLMLFVKQRTMIESFKREDQALMLIQSKLEMIKSNNDAATLVSLLTPVNQANPENHDIEGVSYDLYYEIKLLDFSGTEGGSAHPRLYEIKVSARWNDGEGKSKTLSIATRTNDA